MITRKSHWIASNLSMLVLLLFFGTCTDLAFGQGSKGIRYAVANKTEVTCGPGEDFYVTSYLKSGTAVDVFHQTKDGWCAIRPPDGSFCWLAAENAYLLPGGTVAEVVGNKVPAWIGSATNASRQFKWQIELQPSQQVRILGEAKQKIDNETERLWYRIAPPQGEFRWVRANSLSERAPIADPNDPPIGMELTPTNSQNANANAVASEDQSVRTAAATSDDSRKVIQAISDSAQSQRKEIEAKNGSAPSTMASANRQTNPQPQMGRQQQVVRPDQSTHAKGAKQGVPANRTAKDGNSPAQNTAAPRGLLTDFLTKKSGGNSKKSLLVQENGVQQAQYVTGPTSSQPTIVNQQTEPVQLGEGEYIVGSEEVVADRIVGEGNQGPIVDHGEIVDDGGEYMDQGPVIAHEGNSPFHLSHSDDASLEDWNALNTHPGRVLVRPLNGILGLIGFGIAESEIIAPGHSSSHIVSNAAPNVDPSLAARLDSLPRPTRRHKGHPFRSLLQPSDSNLGYQPEPMPGYTGNDRMQGSNSRSDFASGIDRGRPNAYPGSEEYRRGGMERVDAATEDAWHARNRSLDSSQLPFTSPSYASASLNPVSTNDLEPMQLSTPQLREAFFELTRIVALPSDQWDFRQVNQYANDWIERGASVIERGEARLLQERIQQFESLRLKINGSSISNIASRDNRTMSGSSFGTLPGSTGVNQANFSIPTNTQAEEGSLSMAHQADASGRLSQVFTSRPGQPDFALTDANGGVVAYVVPAPGMNLRRYIDQPVAIYGTKGYLPELASKQIVADRIVRLR